MTTIRAACAEEIPALVEYANDAERNAATAAYLADLLAKGCTKPEWCLVAEEAGKVVGSVVLWTIPGHPVPSDIVMLEAPWGDNSFGTGLSLLNEAAALAKSLGSTELGHMVDSPAQAPQVQRNAEQRAELLRLAGFRVARDGRRFRWTAGDGVPAQDARLTFRSLAELGPEPFISLLEQILSDTKDSYFRADVQKHGLRKAAEVVFEETAGLRHDPRSWELGFEADGSAAVMSLPSYNPGFPVIALVGVSPAHRGKGYSTAVVARGTQILAAEGATEIRGDCDSANVAMFKGFERAGYTNFANRLEFSLSL